MKINRLYVEVIKEDRHGNANNKRNNKLPENKEYSKQAKPTCTK